MTKESLELKEIRRILNELTIQALPQNAVDGLQKAIQKVDDLDKKLDESAEQIRLLALYRVSQSVGSSLNLNEVLNQVMDAVIALTNAERGFLMIHEPDTNVMRARAARNFERENLTEKDIEVSRTVIDTVLKSGDGVVTTDALADSRFNAQESVLMFALRSILCAPLKSRGKTVGVVYVDSRIKEANFSRQDLDLLNTFAVQAAMAIENAQLYTQTDKNLTDRIAELERLTQINQELNSQLDLEFIVQLIQKWAVEGTGAESAYLAYSSPDNPNLTVVAGPNKAEILDPVPGFIQQVLDRAVLVKTQSNQDEYVMAAPISLADKPFGVLVVEGKQPFSNDTQLFLGRLATRSASAIENARLYEAVQHANLAKSKFVSVVSHELRLPMTSIKGYTDLILQGLVGEVNDQQRNFLGVIRNNVERMSNLVSDLSDISRMETGRLRLEIAEITLNKYIVEVVNSLKPKLDERDQAVIMDVPEELPNVNADPNRVIQIITNLLSNAWKYTSSGGEIRIEAKQKEDDFLYISVSDQGIGIAPEDQAQIFRQFFRSEAAAVREQQGWGLGLNVTKNLVELMGGQIGFYSQLGEGSTFWFTLPLSK